MLPRKAPGFFGRLMKANIMPVASRQNLAISKALAFFFHCSSKTPDAAAGFAFCSSSSSLYLEGWPSSKVIIKFLMVMQKHGYIGEFEYVDDHRAGKIVVELNGRLNKCGVISPRFDIGVKEIEGWTARLLPSRQFGYIVLTTSAGIMDHEEARRKNVGGKVLGFFY
ncbi:hypothetical protein V6N12_001462 [Hibiscus sabdariffa]|uniref:Uncharacterized protein n=1 Tax=Hibiscus sabdariffa TaxID=183260 RepID=A0ABR2BR51_9ROSI